MGAGSVRFVKDAPVNVPSTGRLGSMGSPQQAIFWGGSDSSAADKAFSFEDFPLDALLGRSTAENEALPKPLVPMEVSYKITIASHAFVLLLLERISSDCFFRRLLVRPAAGREVSSNKQSSGAFCITQCQLRQELSM